VIDKQNGRFLARRTRFIVDPGDFHCLGYGWNNLAVLALVIVS
jgi:hypothetical protein